VRSLLQLNFPYFKYQLEQTQKILEKAKANAWGRQIEMNEKVKISLQNNVKTLEESPNGRGESLFRLGAKQGRDATVQKKRQDSLDKTDEAIKSLIKNQKPIKLRVSCTSCWSAL
jgi:hypothetical protein